MKTAILYLLLAVLPINLAISKPSSYELSGLWVDHYSDVTLEIKSWRKGLKAREINGYKRGKWRKYYKMGYGVFDDCNGRVIIVDGYDRIHYKYRRRGRSIHLTRYDSYDRGHNRRRGYGNSQYDRYDDDYRRDRTRNYGSRRDVNYGREEYGNRFFGNWYCSARGLNLEISKYGKGFRARHDKNEWTYYDQYGEGQYRDRRGNKYYMDDNDLYWESARSGNRLKFSKR